jgi:hypothetical protein
MKPTQCFKGKNFMTPNILRSDWIIENELAYELSEGRGIYGEKIWGVSVRFSDGEKGNNNDGGCFHSRNQAETHIKDLIDKYNT